jgi:hypothetical protein
MEESRFAKRGEKMMQINMYINDKESKPDIKALVAGIDDYLLSTFPQVNVTTFTVKDSRVLYRQGAKRRGEKNVNSTVREG